MQIETIWIVLAAILVLVELWAINKVRKAEGKSSNKLVWMVVIVFVPLFGLIAWAVAGPKHANPNPHSPQARQ
ncbi:PLD nuclease N-terminal domain-containing protein [Pseudomonas sp. 14P_8.1_Bac3]|uniref:PLD nuclease N-terminal domain-containing protein n=1 Tax=Pseudomonas sp. 14P_8.1_Bac3 TaxID=2971621 RepID=UPI0021C6257A|nr:PLD nuclease N-terminal domain-containing protein [Pseudomonas sp. 14P_8.1_Bac3]MCU1763123.1 PLD nuclease N-terminal domain-containing protein [Pseudomonas sp. 14P_8.1_Bac3]